MRKGKRIGRSKLDRGGGKEEGNGGQEIKAPSKKEYPKSSEGNQGEQKPELFLFLRLTRAISYLSSLSGYQVR